MSPSLTWSAVLATVGILLAYEIVLMAMQRRHPGRLGRTAHARLREHWFESVSQQKGSEILAVQTLRNSLMSATMLASTAVLGLMGTLTLSIPAMHATFGDAALTPSMLTPRLVLELALLALLFISLVSSVMSVRFYNHASYIGALPVGSKERELWGGMGITYVRRAGLLYSWGLRHLVLVVPVLAAVLQPLAGPIAAGVVAVVLFLFDRAEPVPPRHAADGVPA